LLIGAVGFAGWVFDMDALKRIHPALVTMKANTAVCLALAGAALLLLQDRNPSTLRRSVVRALSFVIMAVGLATFLQHIFGLDLGIDQLLFQESIAEAGQSFPGRMGVAASLNFMLIGAAMLTADSRPLARYRFANICTLAATTITLLVFLYYFYGVEKFEPIARYATIAIHTTVGFLSLCLGLILARPERGFARALLGEAAGSAIARRLIPVFIFVPIVLGWLIVIGHQAGHYGIGFAMALFAGTLVVLLVGIVRWTASKLNRYGREARGAQLAMAQSERRYRALAEASNQSVWAWREDGLTPGQNAGAWWEAVTGQPPERSAGTGWLDAVHPDDREPAIRAFLEAIKAKQSYETVYRVIGRDGKIHFMEVRGVPVLGSDGAAEWIGAMSDITDKVEAEQSLRQNEARLAEAQRIAHLGSWELELVNMENLNRNPLHWSDECYRIFGYAPGQVTPTNDLFFEAVHPEDRPLIIEAVGNAINNQTGYSVEHRIRRADGEERIVHERGRAVYGADGKPRRMLGTVQDVTEQKAVEAEVRRLNAELEQKVKERTAELAASNRELEAFCYSVSHDLRAPLRAVNGFSHAILEDAFDKLDPVSQSNFRRIQSAAKKMAELIDDLLNLARLTRQDIRHDWVDLSEMANGIAEDLKRSQPDREARFIVAPDLKAKGDAALLRVVLQNLLENAWKFTARQKQAVIEFGQDMSDKRRPYFVKDNGAGFDMAFVNKLFGPFQRLHSAEEFPGTGIGLASVSRIVQRHGGRVWARAEIGRGATFYFTLKTNRIASEKAKRGEEDAERKAPVG